MVKIHKVQILTFKSNKTPKFVKFDHCALPPHPKQASFDLFCRLSAQDFKNCLGIVLKQAIWSRGSILLLTPCSGAISAFMLWNKIFEIFA